MEKFSLENQEIEPKKNLSQQDKRNDEKEDFENEKRMSRRSFLKKAGLALGTMAVGGAGVKKFFEDSETDSEIRRLKPKEGLKPKEIETSKKESGAETEQRIENLADHYLQAFSELSKQDKFFPGKIFEKDLLIALQCQESRGKIDAKSHSGALGVMQNMDGSIIDVSVFLNKLKRNTDFDWGGPEKLSEDDLSAIKNLIIRKSDYGRAFGKLYLMMLWNSKYGYAVGHKHAMRGNIKSAQIELLGSYNAGFGRIKGKSFSEWKRLREKYRNQKDKKSQREYRAYNEAIGYVEKILNYKNRLVDIRKVFKNEKIEFDNSVDYAGRELSLKLDEYKDKSEALKQYLEKFKQININEKRKITYRDIDRIFGS